MTGDCLEQLEKLGNLRDRGLLTPTEFEEQKRRLLGSADAMVPDQGKLEVKLWNPSAAVSWSLLFSVFFGLCLHLLNWKRLGKPKYVWWTLVWVLAYFLLLAIVPPKQLSEDHGDDRFVLAHMAFLLSWYFTLGKKQIAFVNENYGTEYARRSWVLPFLLFGTVLLVELAPLLN